MEVLLPDSIYKKKPQDIVSIQGTNYNQGDYGYIVMPDFRRDFENYWLEALITAETVH